MQSRSAQRTTPTAYRTSNKQRSSCELGFVAFKAGRPEGCRDSLNGRRRSTRCSARLSRRPVSGLPKCFIIETTRDRLLLRIGEAVHHASVDIHLPIHPALAHLPLEGAALVWRD